MLPTSRIPAAILLLASALAAPVAAQQRPAMTVPASGTLLSLAAEASATADPDIAEIGAGVITEAKTASAALAANATQMTAVVAALKGAGIAERDIQTSGLSVQPRYRYQQNEAPQLIGFQASNQVRARIRNPKETGRVVDALVAAGANQVNGPSFTIDRPEPLLDKARAEAVAIGRARAELYARAAGLSVARIVDIRESGVVEPFPPPAPVMRSAMAMEAQADSPVAPGVVKLTARVQMSFLLE